MQALWVSLKENVKCGSKLTDVVRQPVAAEKERMNGDSGHPMESQASLVVTTPSKISAQLHELSIGDPSRKIVEMIFQRARMNTSSPLKKVRTVFRVSNSSEVLERFEKYREKVKKKACEQYPRHPRCIVDGNEVLRFYGTTMRCSHGKSVLKAKDLCRDPSCCVCQIIQFNFETELCKGNNGFQLSASDKDLCGSKMATARIKTERRAVIVCRIIAGTAIDEVNGELEGSDSNGSGEVMQSSLEKFVVRNPSAILPCFVIVFS